MPFDEERALKALESLIRSQVGTASSLFIEFSNFKLQLSQLNSQASSALGLSPLEEYNKRRVYDGLTRLALSVGNMSFVDLGTQAEATSQSQKIGEATILFLAANPLDTPALRLSEEMREIDACLRNTEHRDRFELRQHWAVRLDDIIDALMRHDPTIVHFSGHGSKSGALIVEDENDNAKPVNATQLRKLFHITTKNVRCVLLNACFSAEQADVIARQVDSVVGMRRSITDSAAIEFARGFYRALGYRKSLQEAFDLGCFQIDVKELDEESTPKLLVKIGVDASQTYFI